jgi:hypothetical protein
VLLGQAGLEVGPALAFFGGQVGHVRRVPLPFGMGVDLGIIQDGGVDAHRHAGHHGQVERVARPGVDLDRAIRTVQDHNGVEEAARQPGDPHLGQPGPGRGEQVRGQLVDHRPRRLGRVQAAGQRDGLGRPGEHREPAGPVALPEHDDVRPAERIVGPVGPADVEDLSFHPNRRHDGSSSPGFDT